MIGKTRKWSWKNKCVWVEVPAEIKTPFDLLSLNKFIQCLYSRARFLKRKNAFIVSVSFLKGVFQKYDTKISPIWSVLKSWTFLIGRSPSCHNNKYVLRSEACWGVGLFSQNGIQLLLFLDWFFFMPTTDTHFEVSGDWKFEPCFFGRRFCTQKKKNFWSVNIWNSSSPKEFFARERTFSKT